MLSNYHKFEALLAQKGDPSLHRHVFIFSGDENWQRDAVKKVLSSHENDALWLGENAPEAIPSISSNKAKNWLGNEKQVVIFDANNNFAVDSFAAISGTVIGGGLFIFLMPEEDHWNKRYSTAFGQRFIRYIRSSTLFNIIKQDNENIDAVKTPGKKSEKQNCEVPFLTFDQQYVVEAIEQEVHNSTKLPVVLVSDRGRGKSAALGIAAARLLKSGIKNIIVTAPRLHASDVIFKHVAAVLPDAEIKRGKIIAGKNVIQFYPPDKLQQENINADLLLVDEAAAIPVPVLISLLNKFSQCVFATTVHGYEGTGRGFSVRFNKVLNRQKPGWKKLKMKTPVRWADNDPLEQWMFDVLCLDAEIADKNTIGNIELHKLNVKVVDKNQLTQDEKLLKEIFSLLIIAHYRTQPGDLQRLLDDDELTLFVGMYKHHVLSVALISHEGHFSGELSSAVYKGERRPSGHLLAQALTYHCGVEHAATLNYSRIMRIAVHPEFQCMGIGSQFMTDIVRYEKKQGSDAIGSSFGLNESLLHFWHQAGFNVVRIGFTREQTSGEHAAIMLQPLSQKGDAVYQAAYNRFLEQCPYWFDDVLADLPANIKHHFMPTGWLTDAQLSDADKKDLESYLFYSRNYELCIAAINKFVLLEQQNMNDDMYPVNAKKTIIDKVLNKKNWKDIAVDMQLNGKKAARQLFKDGILQLYKK